MPNLKTTLEERAALRESIGGYLTYNSFCAESFQRYADDLDTLAAEVGRLERIVASDGNLQEFADADQAAHHLSQENASLQAAIRQVLEAAGDDLQHLLAPLRKAIGET
jgi:hypothetical protein